MASSTAPGSSSAAPRRKRIAILGGGMSSLTAAYELTHYEGWQRRYEITVYQLGWRLGGKTSTGRGPHERIEAVGIHILQGWYDNAFRLLREVYRERREKGLAPESPYPSWEHALEKEHGTLMTEYSPEQGRWTSWQLVFPWNDQVPGEGGALPYWEVFRKGVALAVELMLGTPFEKGRGPLASWLLKLVFPPELERAMPVSGAPRLERLSRKMEEDWRRWLGMAPEEWGMPPEGEPNLVTYANPLYSWIEMSLLMRHEAWPDGARPRALLYLCGTLQEEEPLPTGAGPDFQRRQNERVREITEQWLGAHMGYFFPKGTTPEYPQGLDLNLLAALYAPQALRRSLGCGQKPSLFVDLDPGL